jgi:recombinational DNA repair protein (RecF pathway)
VSYHIYTTDALVLSHRPLKEADRVYSILTRDFGLIRATALGVRKETSKLRGSLEPLSFSLVSVVRGKEFWRITSAMFQSQAPQEFSAPLYLLERLMLGEGAHTELFGDIEEEVRQHDPEDEMSETRLVSKILFHLGYLEDEDLKLPKKSLIQAINKGIEASGLLS